VQLRQPLYNPHRQDVGSAFYGNALVIDALSFLREWDDAELAALVTTGYSVLMLQ